MTAVEWPWERLEKSNRDSHAVVVELAAPRAGERVLDIGTGSGGVALLAARRGANAVGVDVSTSGIERAGERARSEGLDVRFDVGDAQVLPYEDAAFDVVLSAFGINFAPDNRRAANELARVCRPGGRIALALMPVISRTAETFTILRRFGGGHGDHPAAFAERVDELLARDFDFETRTVEVPVEEHPDAPPTWEETVASFGPLREVVSKLDETSVDALRDELTTTWRRWGDRPSSYLVVAGTRT